ncbi:MAG: hypothetical protein JWP75_1084 [Frondihabitans sp.]|nr:hypothetical protein [Frondihabitans sp.]
MTSPKPMSLPPTLSVTRAASGVRAWICGGSPFRDVVRMCRPSAPLQATSRKV